MTTGEIVYQVFIDSEIKYNLCDFVCIEQKFIMVTPVSESKCIK